MKDEVKTSVIIPTKDRVNEIEGCIDSILKQTLPPHEIIIVDSSSNTHLNSFLKENFAHAMARISYVYSPASNLAAARNVGIRNSSGDILFFFDDDVILERDYIEEVVNVLIDDKDCKIMGVMGNITNSERDVDSLGNKLLRLFFLAHFGDGKFLLSGFPTWVHGEKKALKTESLPGCVFAFRREVFGEFMFDETLGELSGYCYLEDVDFCYRVSRKYTLMYIPSARLEHHPSKTTRIDPTTKKRQWIVNHFYLFKKNVPKHLSNIFAFYVSIFGSILLAWLSRDLKATVGILQGIIDMSRCRDRMRL